MTYRGFRVAADGTITAEGEVHPEDYFGVSEMFWNIGDLVSVQTEYADGSRHVISQSSAPFTDERSALSILRKIAADEEMGRIMVQRYPHGGIAGLIDSSWIDITPAEADLLDRLRGYPPT